MVEWNLKQIIALLFPENIKLFCAWAGATSCDQECPPAINIGRANRANPNFQTTI